MSTITKALQSSLVTTKLLFFIAAGLSFLASVSLWFTGNREAGLFVGLWVPSILSAGCLLIVRDSHE